MRVKSTLISTWWLCAASGLVASACGGDDNVITAVEGVASVRVTVAGDGPAFVVAGQVLQLRGEALNRNGAAVTGKTVQWESGNSAVATVSQSGMVTGVRQGTVTITARVDNHSGSTAVQVAEFVLIPAGTFPMGSTAGFGNEQPVHTVTLTRAFRLQTTEVTQAQWQSVMGTNPSSFNGCGSTCPVESVSWDDVQQFLTVLNQRDPGKGYRLPTEAEWEYAARAGTTGDYGGTGVLDQMGWYGANSGGSPHPVGQKLPNAWGLYDMHGNVWEWVQDWYGPYSASPAVDPPGPAVGSFRVLRGGSWFSFAVGARSAYRYDYHPSSRNVIVGFRLARTL